MRVSDFVEKATLMGKAYVYKFGPALNELADEEWAEFHHEMWEKVNARKKRFSEREPTAEQVIRLTDIAFDAAKAELAKRKGA